MFIREKHVRMWKMRVRLLARKRARARMRHQLFEQQLQIQLAQLPAHNLSSSGFNLNFYSTYIIIKLNLYTST